ncbi:DUF3944 domain-containing protein [Shewanella sp. ZOR0012]|uniref:DUF3944 domain-containing protein n=1 Tax=Shewanella sp. ZOR0012 TaxID=1339231 RepID=UPI00068D3AC5|nr:DUF3944 domain-containing protein [Shewanella sp. ZOR0012]NSM24248.1 DUF3944 domain-containing protein [Shewanella sp. ZOR0012]
MDFVKRNYMYREDDDLQFLSLCTHKQLTPLVKYLTKDKTGKLRTTETLTTNPRFKKNKHDLALVWQEICAELQTFGNSTVMNLITGKGGTYLNLLQYTARSIGCSVSAKDKDSALAIEKAIVAKVMKLQLDKMTQADRSAFVERMSKDYQCKIDNALDWSSKDFAIVSRVLASAFGGAAVGAALLPRVLMTYSPMGVLGGIFSIFADAPNVNVTLPCVIHIAMLRELRRNDNPFK